MDVVAAGVGDLEPDCVSDDEGDGLGFEFARVARYRPVACMVKQFVGVFMGEHHERLRRRQAVQDLDPAAARRAQRAAKVSDAVDDNAPGEIAASRHAVVAPGSPAAWATSGSGAPSVCSTSYLEIWQPGQGNAALAAEGATCRARIRGARGDAFRTEWPRLFKNADPFGSRKPPENPAAFCESNGHLCPGTPTGSVHAET